MPLISLKTNLKSLKYEKDRPGGDSSGQPYIVNDINDPTTTVSFEDGFIRGGALGALRSSVNDTIRIKKFLTDKPRGPLFVAKQIGLQFSNPKLEVKKGPLGIITRSGALQPTRLYNAGINTLAQIPVNAVGIHFNRHGILPVQDESTKYLSVVKTNNQNTGTTNANLSPNSPNRLLRYAEQLLPVAPPIIKPTGVIRQLLTLIPGASLLFKPRQMMIENYIGGPGSVYGVGRTFINRYDYTTNGFNKQQPQEKGKVNYYNTLGLSTQYFVPFSFPITNQQTTNLLFGTRNAATLQRQGLTPTSFSIPNSPPTSVQILDYNNIDTLNPTTVPSQINNNTAVKYKQNIPAGANGTSNSPTLRTYQELRTQINNQQSIRNINSVGIYNSSYDGTKIDNTKGKYNVTQLGAGNIQYQNSYGEVVRIKGYSNWGQIARENRVGDFGEAKYLTYSIDPDLLIPIIESKTVRAADQINLTPLFEVSNSSKSIGDRVTIQGTQFLIRDLVKFRIQAIDGDDPTKSTFMVFRAYVTQFSDSVNATWNNVKYAGRGENFYIYGGFDRSISINFKVAALSVVEMEPMYQKLNYLMSNLMPDYKGTLMRGPMTRMTIGNWLDGQDGIITSLTYNVPQESPWEISLGEDVATGVNTLNLPHIVEVNMTFLPIGSQTRGENKISRKSSTTSHLAQNVNKDEYQMIDIDGNYGDLTGSIPQGKI
jgi:hypothetical protein